MLIFRSLCIIMPSMSGLPEVTVIIPSYNHADYVETAIGSVLSQTFRDIEVIVVDDGSTDGSQEKISRIKDPRLNFIALKENRRAHPRNLALSMAKGRYIAFQNSDDEWLPDKLENQLRFMENSKETVACFTRVAPIDKNGAPWSGKGMSRASWKINRSRFKWLRRFFVKGNCLRISSSVVRGSALKLTGHFCPSLFYMSDFDLWVRLAGIGDIHIVDDPLTRMRMLGDKNLSSPSRLSGSTHAMEYTRVLSRYAEAPIVNDSEKIFWGHKQSCESLASKYVMLARCAVDVGEPPHMLFADRTFSHILENRKMRKQALDLFGPGLIEEFLAARSKIRIMMSDENKP
jgi:glycosyltransferase involved in cell wall biosynthesis